MTRLNGLAGGWQSVGACLREVQVDLVAVEVSIESCAVGVVHTDRALPLQHNVQRVIGRCAKYASYVL